jgi:hypothetical protein
LRTTPPAGCSLPFCGSPLNSRTGEPLEIKAGKTVRFRASKVLKEAV